MSIVDNDILDGFCKVEVSGETMYWSPPFPPLPLIDTFRIVVVPPNEFIPDQNTKAHQLWIQSILGSDDVPLRFDVTENGIPEMGTLPMVVLAVTLAVPLRSNTAASLSVT